MIYVFGLIPSLQLDRQPPAAVPGMDGITPCVHTRHGDTVVVSCFVEENEYSQERLQANVQDPDWLRVAGSRHHACIEAYHNRYTVIPMSFGTIFTSESSLFATLDDQAENIGKLFKQLDGKEEWNVRIYYDRNQLAASVASNAPAVVAFRKELALMPAGKQFLMSKKADRLIAEETDRELMEQVDRIHQAILQISAAHRSKQVWPKSLTGRGDDMAANHAYLIPKESRDEFLEIVGSCRETLGDEAWSTEITGPWPPYHFAELS